MAYILDNSIFDINGKIVANMTVGATPVSPPRNEVDNYYVGAHLRVRPPEGGVSKRALTLAPSPNGRGRASPSPFGRRWLEEPDEDIYLATR